MTARRAAMLLPVVLALVLAACTSSSSSSGGSLTVSDAWARKAMSMDMAGAAYMNITNGTGQADALLGVETDVAASPEIHETTEENGMMAMHPVERIEIPAGGTVELKPGGYHVMLIGLTRELEVGSTIDLTLKFEKAGDVKVQAEVKAAS
jgi:copper(I)-binding protein